jgi:hypothetical protein
MSAILATAARAHWRQEFSGRQLLVPANDNPPSIDVRQLARELDGVL